MFKYNATILAAVVLLSALLAQPVAAVCSLENPLSEQPPIITQFSYDWQPCACATAATCRACELVQLGLCFDWCDDACVSNNDRITCESGCQLTFATKSANCSFCSGGGSQCPDEQSGEQHPPQNELTQGSGAFEGLAVISVEGKHFVASTDGSGASEIFQRMVGEWGLPVMMIQDSPGPGYEPSMKVDIGDGVFPYTLFEHDGQLIEVGYELVSWPSWFVDYDTYMWQYPDSEPPYGVAADGSVILKLITIEVRGGSALKLLASKAERGPA